MSGGGETKSPNRSKIALSAAGMALAANSCGRDVARAAQPQRGVAMNSLHSHPHANRVLLASVAALVLLVVMSAAAAAAEPVTSDQFAPGWQSDAHPLIKVGIQSRTGRDKWYVPSILPRGEYVLINRTGDKAELIDYRFTVDSDNARQYLFLEPGYSGDVEAMPARDVPARAAASTAAAQR
jgi:hypothetical protein